MDKIKNAAKNTAKKFNNIWQTILILIAMTVLGMNVSNLTVTEERVTEIAKEVAQETLVQYGEQSKAENALEKATQFVQGYIERGQTLDIYISKTYENRTGVFNGGLTMVDNQYETRTILENKFGKEMVDELVEALINFNYKKS